MSNAAGGSQVTALKTELRLCWQKVQTTAIFEEGAVCFALIVLAGRAKREEVAGAAAAHVPSLPEKNRTPSGPAERADNGYI